MQIERILNNDLTILAARSNEGKSIFLAQLVKEYTQKFNGTVWVCGMKEEITNKLPVKTFKSLIELEEIESAIVIIDEVGQLFDLTDKRKQKQVDQTLRTVNHKGNKILLAGLPTDFKKYLCAKAKCFLLKSLKITDLINGSEIKSVVSQYSGDEKGTFLLKIPINEVLCYDGHYWKEKVEYVAEFDTKKNNTNLFEQKVQQKEQLFVTKKKGTEKHS